MEKVKKIKIYIGLFYLIIVGIFLYYLFSKFSLQELSSYEFIKDNIEYFSKIKTNNIFLLSLLFLLFTILWVFPFFRIWISCCIISRFHSWKMDWFICSCFRFKYWCIFFIYFCKFFFKRFCKRKIFK